jgi:hypothetical protein
MPIMQKLASILNNEEGSVILFSIMILALLMIVSVSSTTTSNTEVQIASNERVYQQNFYMAEGATIEAVEDMEQPNNLEDLKDRSLPYVNDPGMDMSDPETWNFDDADGDDNSELASNALDPEGNTCFSAVYQGVAPGSSLGLGKTRVHAYQINGMCNNSGVSMIEIGYLKAFK